MTTLLSIGHGYSARALARLLLPMGWHVIGTVRSAEKAAAIAAEGVEPLVWPDADLRPAMDRCTHLLTSVAPGPNGDPVLTAMGDEIGARRDRLTWAGYLSTTGVYGDHRGDWVDEKTPLTPSTRRGQQRVTAEAGWQALAQP